MPETDLIGALELGGTKIVMATGHADGTVLARETISTCAPGQVMPQIARFFAGQARPVRALGVGAFGPIVVDPHARCYGHLLETNKPGWSHFDLVGALTDHLPVPVRLLTDVGAAAIAEARIGALRGAALGVYLTVGTGIGGAIVCNGSLLPAALHPEMGHVALRRAEGDEAPSVCAFHSDCAEGLASGPAIIRRWGSSLSEVTQPGPELALIAGYLGQLCAKLVLTLSPHRIVIGGGVAQTPGLVAEVERRTIELLGNYAVQARAGNLVTLPHLGQESGITGSLITAGELCVGMTA